MSDNTFMAVFTGSPSGPRGAAWNAMSEDERNTKVQAGMAAWTAWMETHKGALVDTGGPLGKTRRVSNDGVADVSNQLSAFVIVRAPSHDAAARMFEGHPHFSIFPGDAVDVMPVMPIPGR